MNRSSRKFLVLVLGLLALSAAAWAAAGKTTKPTPASAKGTPNFQRTKTRIDALLTQRLKPDPLPDPLPNPFQLAETAPAPTTQEKNPKPIDTLPVSSDSEMLLYYGASLKISGTVRINDKTHLVINQAPYKEGDLLTIKTKDATAKLRVIGIAPGELTLGLNEAVQVIKFKK
jgi:hypothetical protein